MNLRFLCFRCTWKCKMETKQKMSEFQKRLDKTLSSQNLTNEEYIKNLLKKQVLRSSPQCEIQEPTENIIEERAKEALNFLNMLRSASQDDSDVSQTHEKPQADWKLKEDNEEFKVMYREGPQGTPFHMILVEGFVDAPVDVCICVAWESSLYKKWWPQLSIPTFKIATSSCLQKVRIGEQICLVRMKFSWPLSAREAVMRFLELDFFEDDLIVGLINSISDLQSVDRSTHGFTNEGIPEEKDVIRIDIVGGFAFQKVSSNRSYFRTILTMDVKLEFVPPSLINFVSRQIFGSGYKLFKKMVISAAKGDKDFSKALEDRLYVQIREGLNPANKIQKALEPEALKSENITFAVSEEHGNGTPQAKESVYCQVSLSNDLATEALPADSLVSCETCCGGIVEEVIGQDKHLERSSQSMDHSPTDNFAGQCHINKGKKVYISPEVENALGILNEAISMVRAGGICRESLSPGSTNEEYMNFERVVGAGSSFPGAGAASSGGGICIDAPNVDNFNSSLEEDGDVSGIYSTRETIPASPMKEVNWNRIIPVSPGQNFPISNKSQGVHWTSLQNGSTSEVPVMENTADGNKEVNVKASSTIGSWNGEKGKLRRQRIKKSLCCLH
ncbi:uncharacterized protein LOC122086530 isoform X3 [Macadamia integrifolia]|uniref:uncharacterized protein LOC122086530 isoform X3 n=1 Tax=Macadamia integrifolia TaxID=60698 RepID=UPI001C4FBE9F|nr:uncharacterized protein LOC122086530 isoform X3 [Macadamia integrifolia]